MNTNLPDNATLQQVFDHVLEALREQGKAAITNISVNGSYLIPKCAYRTPDGSKCAAGHCITDEQYNPNFEGKSIRDLIDTGCIVFKWISNRHLELITDLQGAHDRELLRDGIVPWEQRMKEIAKQYNLTYKEAKYGKSS